MVRRIFWMAVGAGTAVWAMNKANEAAQRLTPDSLSGTAARGALQLGDAARRFARDVRAGMAEREDQLRADLGLDGTAVVEPPRRRAQQDRALQGRAIKAAPGASRPVALPPSRTTPTPQIIASTPRRLEQRRGQHP
ncbi:DUF6167 family protein [Kitasatospora sp. RB6PN24]|uniref:DUF6167 family protein n=1 Tax=Kitasatospora humi TaxID=2893891 RepID=UPI001E6113ED|nr:DUF6167 family protein [Kitasatospora humi]MCC9305689.1 DUF6167 family protein [Kitasatospora humi]